VALFGHALFSGHDALTPVDRLAPNASNFFNSLLNHQRAHDHAK